VRDVDVRDHHHPAIVEEHLSGIPLDVELAGQRQALRRPAPGGQEPLAGEHEDTGPVVLHEIRLIHAFDLRVGLGVRAGGGGLRPGAGTGRGGNGGATGGILHHATEAPPADIAVLYEEVNLLGHVADGGLFDVPLELAARGKAAQGQPRLHSVGAADVRRSAGVAGSSQDEQGKQRSGAKQGVGRGHVEPSSPSECESRAAAKIS
jgi:hypothetical protein